MGWLRRCLLAPFFRAAQLHNRPAQEVARRVCAMTRTCLVAQRGNHEGLNGGICPSVACVQTRPAQSSVLRLCLGDHGGLGRDPVESPTRCASPERSAVRRPPGPARDPSAGGLIVCLCLCLCICVWRFEFESSRRGACRTSRTNWAPKGRGHCARYIHLRARSSQCYLRMSR